MTNEEKNKKLIKKFKKMKKIKTENWKKNGKNTR